MTKELSDREIQEIKVKAREKLGVCRKTNEVIGRQIFNILSLYARVIFYPLGEKAPWGFTRISGMQSVGGSEKPFVVINTSIVVPCQVFAAAHELYHIWYKKKPDILPNNLLDEKGSDRDEKMANRFAAEFLVDEMVLRQEIDAYNITDCNIKAVLLLADLFVVPYRAMVKRLYETGYIDKNTEKKLLSEPDESLKRYRKKYAFSFTDPDNRIAVDNLAELSVNAYESGLITYEKLEYLLDICGLTPEEVGVAILLD
ncbi:MAG: ImmA/IrrE family metallo-endopeptidase [Eubacterium sp.]|nr:ImmA/IrrE family metallo-endopeptidase [Eubacterium sp.]